MGFRRSEVRILSARLAKARCNKRLRRAFFHPRGWVLANSLANSPGVRAGGASPLSPWWVRERSRCYGRPRKPYFRSSDGWWVSRFQGEYVKLAKGREN